MADRQADLAGQVRAHQAGGWRYQRVLGCRPHQADDRAQETVLAVIRDGVEQRSAPETAANHRAVARNRLRMA
ncbi:MAG: hypothetical protein QM844_03110, partial [Planctomycetota bacterium]|nr:hypothetical protein [Planctomycetota bacterium]